MRKLRLVIGVLSLFLLATLAKAQGPALTTVSDTIYGSNGQPANGSITISTPIPFISQDGYPIPARVNATVPITNGVFSAALVPTVATMPGGAYYIAGYNFSGGSYTQYWVVPVSGSPVALMQVVASAPPIPTISVPIAQVTPPADCISLGGFIEWTSQGWTCGQGGGGGASIFTSFKFDGNTAITGTGNYLELTGSLSPPSGALSLTQSGSGVVGDPYIDSFDFFVQGSDPRFLMSASISAGAGAPLCIDSNGGANTTVCNIYNQTIEVSATPVTQQPTVNLVPGSNMAISCVNNAGPQRTDCTFTASNTGATAFSALTPSTNNTSGNFIATGNVWNFSGATSFTVPIAGLTYLGATSGSVIVTAPAIAGSSLISWPAGSGTVAVGASGVLSENSAGIISCLGCATTVNGGALSSTSPIVLSNAGNISCPTCNVSAASVTSVALATNAPWYTVSGSPITNNGTLTFNLTTGLGGNQVLATPNGSSGAVGLRALAGADIPAINLAATGNGGVTGSLPYSSLSGTPTIYYQTIEANAGAQTQRLALNLIAGSNMTVSCADNAGLGRTDCTLTSTSTAATAWSAITAATNSNAGTFIATGNSWTFSGANAFTLPTVGAIFPGSSSGNITLLATAIAGSNTITLPAATGTVAVSASSPVTLSGTGQIACSTCNTSNATVSSFSAGNISSIITTSVSNATTTPSLSFTVAGTSGGVACFTSATNLNTSAALTANAVVIGGGAGVCPSTISTSTTTTQALFATAGAPAFRNIGIQDTSPNWYVAGGGSANVQTATFSPAVSALVSGLFAEWLPIANNTTTTPTFAPNGLTAHTLVKAGGAALSANDLTTTAVAVAIYNTTGTRWELLNPQTASSGGSVTGATFTGGLVSVSGSVTLAFTVAGTSGGVPYFSSASTWASSGVLTTNCFVKGGGVAGAPSSGSVCDNGTLVSSTEGFSIAPTSTSQVALIANNPSGTSADIAEFQVNGVTVAKIDSSGNIYAAIGSTVAGQAVMQQGTAATVPTNGIGITVPTSVPTGYSILLPSNEGGANEVLQIASITANVLTMQWGTVSGAPCTSTASSLQYDNAGALGCIANFTSAGSNITAGASGILDLSAATGTAAFKVPSNTTNTATAAGVIDFDTTNKNFHGYVNAADSIFANFASAPSSNVIPKVSLSSGNLLLTSSLEIDNGTTMTYTGTGGYSAPSFAGTGSTAGFLDLAQGATSSGAALCTTANSLCIQVPTSVTSYVLDLPGAQPSGSNTFLSCTAANPSVCSWAAGGAGGGDTITSPNSTLAIGGTSTNTTLDLLGAAGKIMAGATPALTYTPTLGISGTAGTLAMFPASGNFTTTWGSAATASNTILGFVSAPTTGDLISCTTATTTCTLTDAGVLAANVNTNSSNYSSGQVPVATGNHTLAGNTNLTWSSPTLTIGTAGTTTGILLLASSTATGSVSLTPAASASAFTATLPANTGTIDEINLAQTVSAVKTFSSNPVIAAITNTGTLTLPTATGTIVETAAASTYTAGLQNFNSVTMEIPSSAAYAPTTASLFGYDSTNNRAVLGNGVNTSFLDWVTAAVTSGNIPSYSGTLGALGAGYTPKGTDTSLLTAGTVSGTANLLCVDANGGATTSGCAEVNEPAVTNTTLVNVAANTTSDQTMQELALPSGYLNTASVPFVIHSKGYYSLTTGNPTLTFKAKLCTMSGCGSGSVVTIASMTTGASGTSASNATWNLSLNAITTTTGASGQGLVQGFITIDLGTAISSSDTVYNDTSTAAYSAISLTGALYIDFTVATSSGSTSNTFNNIASFISPVSSGAGLASAPCTYGTGGTFCAGEGTAPTAATGYDQFYADSTYHQWLASQNDYVNNNSVAFFPVQVNVLTTQTTTYGASVDDDTILCNGTFTTTLPITGIPVGKVYHFKNIGTGTCTLSAGGATNIDGATTWATAVKYTAIEVHWDGSQYWIF